MTIFKTFIVSTFALSLLTLTPSVADACNPKSPRCNPTPDPEPEPEPEIGLQYYRWMHPEVDWAFSNNITGLGSHLVILDNFSSNAFSGNLVGQTQTLTHGEWTSLQSRLVAPGASYRNVNQPTSVRGRDRTGVISNHYASGAAVQVVNMSFGLFDPEGTVVDADYSFGNTLWDSLADEAWNGGNDIFVKAAGNTNGQHVDTGTIELGLIPANYVDTLNISLIGAPNALFVGALDWAPTNYEAGDAYDEDGNLVEANLELAPTTIADYSTIAGSNTMVQDMFLVARVNSAEMGFAGTSFAAPYVSGIAAMVGGKHQNYLSNQSNAGELVVDRLLQTARTDTISNFSDSCTLSVDNACKRSSVYGVGEVSLRRAVSPDFVPD